MHEASAETDIANPLTGSGSVVQDQFIGDSTCTVFADRLLSSLQPQGLPASALVEQFYVKRDEFRRQIVDPRACKFPDRIRANLLVRVALRFIGQDYHFFIHKEFLHQLERVYIYKDAQYADSAWACKFFVVLALGELYSGTLPTESRNVPGTDHFVNASLLLEDMYEEPSLTQVEIMLLFVSESHLSSTTPKGLWEYNQAEQPLVFLLQCIGQNKICACVQWTSCAFRNIARSTSSAFGDRELHAC